MYRYPHTKKQDVTDTYFSHSVADPYRWLEDDLSQETADWVNSQNEVTFGYLNQIPFRDAIRNKLAEAFDYVKESAPFKHGSYTYFFKNDGLQNHAVLHRFTDSYESADVFLDPNTWHEDGIISLDSVEFSESDKYVAYSTSEGGSDWRTIHVIDAETGEQVEAPIQDAKFTGISWQGDEGFYYSTYDKPEGSELSARTEHHKLYFHKLGTAQETDILVFGRESDPQFRYVHGYTTSDNNYLVVGGANTTSCNMLYVKDLGIEGSELVKLTDDESARSHVITHKDGQLVIYTNLNAPMAKVVKVDVKTPHQDNWQDLIPETEHKLTINFAAGYIFANYLVDVQTQIKQYDLTGKWLRDITLPALGCATLSDTKEDNKDLYFSFTNFTTPSEIYSLHPDTGETALYRRSKCKIKSEELVSTQIFYTSKDGTKVPLTICHKKGIELDGSHPTILYGYGGFQISLEPAFNPFTASWVEMGGIYAVANLRGGGEYGKDWHVAGTQLNKQNVFDDFIAAAEYLIDEKYTSSNALAINGGSNGGLLVGACMTQRPELFRVAMPAVGVLDMLRYHTFTSGEGWKYDYGTSSQSEEMFNYLLGYSPVHNVKEGTCYPSTLVTTADHDDRVVPAHSYKFIAELQEKHAGENPVMIRIDVNAGHGAGMPTHKVLDGRADVFSFCLDQMSKTPNL
ncbi:S9 family peptidase [Veronia nyctiphanis]|uniref:prolyl oligopeptidase n=1 Tax=Veronia nyctiphanis TaxID=1278244 RepID=A0A4Q0YTH4_9GAMM|nr:prolyl oligopeptidase family serine peptidase [Veronia nyctiphanis]RXJ74015.1 S9 family peptidase [Veronia nyctiphanis]